MMNIPILSCKGKDGTYSDCTKDQACALGDNYESNTKADVINWLYHFGLMCGDTALKKLLFYFFFSGFFLGAVLLAPLADYFGRKALLILSIILLCLVHLKLVFTYDVVSAAVVLCFSGLLVGTFYCVAITYLTEITPQESAMIYTIMFHLSFPISGTIVVIMLRYFGNWIVVTVVMSLVPLAFLAFVAYMAESPRFLASKDMYQDARHAANIMCAYNTGKRKHWVFNNENAQYMKEYVTFAETREKKFLQHFYFLTYPSCRYYLLAFAILLYCSGFAFGGLVLDQKKIFLHLFFNSLMLYFAEGCVLFIAGFLIQALGHNKAIGFALLTTGGLTVVSIILTWLSEYAYGLVGYIAKLFVFTAFVSSISFAAEVCPARVRATGFGISVGIAMLGLMSGGFVLEFHDNLHILFGIVAVVGIIALSLLKEPEMYLTNDDIYEVSELRKNNFVNDTQKSSPLAERMGKPMHPYANSIQSEEIIKHEEEEAKEIEVKLEQPTEDSDVIYKVEGTRLVKDRKEPLGISLFQLSLKGEVTYEAKDEIGEYRLDGQISQGNKVVIIKKYKDGKEITYTGTRTGAAVKGEWSDQTDKGDFDLDLNLQLWKGAITVNENNVDIEWYLYQTGRKIHGLAMQGELAYFICGTIQESSELNIVVASEKGERVTIEGTLQCGKIDGKFQHGTVTLKAVKTE